MKLAFLKIDKENIRRGIVNEIDFAPGQIQFELKGRIIALAEPITIQVDRDGMVLNVMQDIQFYLYRGNGIEPDDTLNWTLLSVVTAANNAVYNKVFAKVFGDKVIPFPVGRTRHGAVQPYDEQSLFARLYAQEIIKLVGV